MVVSDKITNVLERCLKTIGQPIRIEILKKLSYSKNGMTFSALQKEVLGNNPGAVNFTFHLNTLKKCNFIASVEEGYTITILGQQILTSILSMENVINQENKVLMIRTSKYSKEPFDEKKIESYLIQEGEMEPFLAKKIAQEVKARLMKTSIDYLTAPLMREYINVVLLENGLEKIRHKLTRLGTPPFEVSKLFNDSSSNPETFLKKLGSDVSEQYLLLNLLPNDLADLYLSGDIALLHLNSWSLRPLSTYINSNSILRTMSKIYPNFNKKIDTLGDAITFIVNFIDLISKFRTYFSEDLVLGSFNKVFLSALKNLKLEDMFTLLKILTSELRSQNYSLDGEKSRLSLEFSYNGEDVLNSEKSLESQFLISLLNNIEVKAIKSSPLLLIDSKFLGCNDLANNNLAKSLFKNIYNDIIFYDNFLKGLENSCIVHVGQSNNGENTSNQIVLDKILINLSNIAIEAKSKDDLFFDLLSDKVQSVFDFFYHKASLVNKKLNHLEAWSTLRSSFFEEKNLDCVQCALKSVSFFGLNEAVKYHCGIELDRIEKSEKFALKILSNLNKLIYEQNEEKNEHFVLSQPHEDPSLKNSMTKIWSKNIGVSEDTGSFIARKDSKLSLDRSISLFKKFEALLQGGSLFQAHLNANSPSFYDDLRKLLTSNLKAFSITNIH